MAKYYAVKVGLTTGIFDNWDECKASVTGYPGALYKSFKNLSDAYAYLGIESEQISLSDFSENTVTDIPEPFSDETRATAYVDGSFNVETTVFSYGVVMFYNGKEIHLNGSDNDNDLASMRNVAGEIQGAMVAMAFALEKGCTDLVIYHDYEGISKWPLGLWQTNKNGTIAYKKYYDSIKEKINIKFVKVKGHSGDKFNDLADKLAKKAAGIEV